MCRHGYQSPQDATETTHETSWISTTVYLRGRKKSSLIRLQSEVIVESVFSCYITYCLLHFLLHLSNFSLHIHLTIDAASCTKVTTS